jgi:hypothetical protein
MNKYLILIALMLAVNSANAKTVKFAVDMTGQTISPNGVHVAGDFQYEAGFEGGDWQSNTTVMSIESGTEIYSVVVDIPAFAKYEYKFINGDQWYEVEFVPLESRVGYDFNDNRWVYVDSLYNDTAMIPPVLFSGNAPAFHYLLRLKVNMDLEESIDPAGIHLAGDFQNWDPAATLLYSFADKVYERIVYIEMTTGDSHEQYRFINGNSDVGYEIVPPDCSESGNRFVEVFKDTVMESVCFSACVNCNAIGTAEIPRPSQTIIYPNPCHSSATLEFNDAEPVHNVTVTDILGKTVQHFKDYRMNSLTISRDNLKNGVYFVKLESGNTWLSTLRLVISQ